LENLWRLPLPEGQWLYSGGQPQGESGFRSLTARGVRTVISVDGAPPEIETARMFGLRYVHLPIGYDGVPEERLRQMVQAVRSLPGPVYVHCHHGKHRGPASAVCLWRSMNSNITPNDGIELLRTMGAHAKYAGLYRAVELVPANSMPALTGSVQFPEVTPVSPLAEQMVAIDGIWEQLQAAASTTTRPEESARRFEELWTDLAERFHESARMRESPPTESDRELTALLAETGHFMELAAGGDQIAVSRLPSRLRLLESRCTGCHAGFRD
jgi:protein tyrosine phosphatase (PTP) superfamily phosphohydrolase (DUF442 family)